ncbi:MAG: molybdopterin converting factor subunit 1, partial [Candidatus Sedimenticola sp. (ex Thyasira tokunagai)]
QRRSGAVSIFQRVVVMIKVLYFARLKEQLDTASEEMDAEGVAALGDLVQQLQGRGGVWQEAFGDGQTVMMALNQEMADATTTVADGDEVAFFPPVTGG